MNIIISGYGRMGREIEKIALETGDNILFRLNHTEDWDNAGKALKKGDAIIDFSWPDTARDNIRKAFDLGIPVVCGTTGWDDQLAEVKAWCENEAQTLFVAANFSIGVNVMLHLSGRLARIMDRLKEYDLTIEEIHHIHKLDSPSGTAIRIAEEIINQMREKKGWSAEAGKDPALLQVTSRRQGEVPGTHILKAESENDALEIMHQAKSRRGFATGALLAARFIQGKKGFYTMKDLLELTD
jgi:4-hydroxy-tetrahydrodipicolinate reductase